MLTTYEHKYMLKIHGILLAFNERSYKKDMSFLCDLLRNYGCFSEFCYKLKIFHATHFLLEKLLNMEVIIKSTDSKIFQLFSL